MHTLGSEVLGLTGVLCALQNGTIDMIASDHSPATPELKLLVEGDFLNAWGGIAGEFRISVEKLIVDPFLLSRA